MLVYIIATIVLSYFIGKTMASRVENENERLRQHLVFVKNKRKQEKEHYQERIHLMNDAFDQFKKGN